MVVAAVAEGRGTVFTSGWTPWEARAQVGAVERIVDALDVAREIDVTVNQALLFDVVAELGALVSKRIVLFLSKASV